MEIIREARRIVVPGSKPSASVISRTVQGTVYLCGRLPYKFHDVHFPAVGPAYVAEIVPQHPEGGPDSLPVRKPGSHFDFAVLEAEFAIGLDTAGGILVSAISLPHGFYDQIPVVGIVGVLLHINIIRTIGVVFQFAVAPTAASGFINPFRSVHSRTRRTVEFVAPDEPPVAAGRIYSHQAQQTACHDRDGKSDSNQFS